MTIPLCADPSCGKPLPPAAIKHGDPWCSATCARKHHGTELPATRNPTVTKKACDECGCGLDDLTAGCGKCRRRHSSRRLRQGAKRESAAELRYRQAWGRGRDTA